MSGKKPRKHAHPGIGAEYAPILVQAALYCAAHGRLIAAPQANAIAKRNGILPHEVENSVPWFNYHRAKNATQFKEDGSPIVDSSPLPPPTQARLYRIIEDLDTAVYPSEYFPHALARGIPDPIDNRKIIKIQPVLFETYGLRMFNEDPRFEGINRAKDLAAKQNELGIYGLTADRINILREEKEQRCQNAMAARATARANNKDNNVDGRANNSNNVDGRAKAPTKLPATVKGLTGTQLLEEHDNARAYGRTVVGAIDNQTGAVRDSTALLDRTVTTIQQSRQRDEEEAQREEEEAKLHFDEMKRRHAENARQRAAKAEVDKKILGLVEQNTQRANDHQEQNGPVLRQLLNENNVRNAAVGLEPVQVADENGAPPKAADENPEEVPEENVAPPQEKDDDANPEEGPKENVTPPQEEDDEADPEEGNEDNVAPPQAGDDAIPQEGKEDDVAPPEAAADDAIPEEGKEDDVAPPQGDANPTDDVRPAAAPKEEVPLAAAPKEEVPLAAAKEDEPVAAAPKEDEPVAAAPKEDEPPAAAPKEDVPLAAAPKEDEPPAAAPKEDLAAAPKEDEPPAAAPKEDVPPPLAAEDGEAAKENTAPAPKEGDDNVPAADDNLPFFPQVPKTPVAQRKRKARVLLDALPEPPKTPPGKGIPKPTRPPRSCRKKTPYKY